MQRETIEKQKAPIGLYIHIPFCKQKCYYCDFLSFGGVRETTDYTRALCAQIRTQAAGRVVSSVFFGGGTPTVMPTEQIEEMMQTLQAHVTILPDSEITIEANPGTLDAEKLRRLRKMGFNRLSMGLQAWQDELLKRLGRIHTREQFLQNFYEAREAGFDNINLDLMFALPMQSVAEWEETLVQSAKLSPEHISAYSLIVEEGTPFWQAYESGQYQPLDEENERKMYEMSESILQDFGYHRYEISNYAKKGKESRHNSLYWQAKEYLGLGLGAHSYLDGKRFCWSNKMEEFLAQAPQSFTPQQVQVLSLEDKMSEFFFLGLRMTQGVEKSEFFRRFGRQVQEVFAEAVTSSVRDGLLAEEGDRIFLTARGLDLSNQVFVRFLL